MNRREAIQRAGLVLGYAVSAPVLMGIMKGCKAAPELTYKPVFFTEDQARIVSEIAEIIIPKTDTPGAKDTGVAAFIDQILKECYKKEDQDRFISGLGLFDEEAKKVYGDSFIDLEPAQQMEHVKKVHDEALKASKEFEEVKKSLVGQKYVTPLTDDLTSKYGAPDVKPDAADGNKLSADFPTGDIKLEVNKSTNNIADVSKKNPFILIMKELTVTGFFTSKVGAEDVLHYDPVPGAYHGCVPLAEVGKTWAT